jgi:hypothetical protein
MLCHTDDRYAGEHDHILFAEDTGRGYTLVVQTDVRGWTFADDIRSVLAVIPAEKLADAPRGLIGPRSPLDSRWQYKRNEVRRLLSFTSRYLNQLLTA